MLKKFKPAKCKTSLNLAKSRIKLLKNKKDIQVKQLRREVAQLLNSGQDQTARIRVEHVVREEKTMAAFELIEIYCELVVARLPIVESQKNCPLDLKEAITSLIFAAPRCGDIPELQDVRKHFIAKYGKEFVTAATELRPDCGVSRNLVEKLSVKAPDGPAKVKILTAIAEEHNIKWEPNWFKDEDPMPSVEMPKQQPMEKHGMIQMQPLDFEIADSIQQPRAPESSSLSYSRANISANDVPPSSTARPNGSYSDSMGRNDFETDRPNWTMEFKDATAAAQAAAESAERASMAARAAAELSRHSNVVNNNSSGSLPSSHHDRNEGKRVFSNTSFNNQRSPRMQQVDQVSGYEHGNVVNNTSSIPLASSGHNRNEGMVFSNTSFNNPRSPRMQVDQVGEYEQGNLTKGTDARGVKEESTDSRVQYGSEKEYYRESEDDINPLYHEVRQSRDPLPIPSAREHEYDVFESPKHQIYENVHGHDFSLHEETAKMKVQPDSFKAQSSAFGDEYGIFSNLNDRNKENYSNDEYYGGSNQQTANYDDWHVETVYHSDTYDSKEDRGDRDRILDSVDQKYGSNSSEDIFASMDHKTNEMDNLKEVGTKTDIRAVFDDSGSDDNEPIFDFAEKSYGLPSPVKSPPKHSAFYQENQSSFSSRPHNTLDISESFLDSTLYAKLSEPVPMAFDSDGESSESEREVESEKTAHRVVLVNDDDRNHQHINPDMSDENEESQSMHIHSTVKHKFDAEDLYTRQPSYGRPTFREESHDFDRPEFENETRTGAEGGMELNFGKLPGGLRNKRQWDPPYRRGTVLYPSSSPKSSRAVVDRAFYFQDSSSEAESTKISVDTSTEKGSNNEEIPYSPTIHEAVHKTQKYPITHSYSEDISGFDNNTPKEPTMSRPLLGAGLSRRTTGSATRLVSNSQPSSTLNHIPGSSSHTPEISRKIQTPTYSSLSGPKTKVSKEAYSAPSPNTEKQMTPKQETEIPRAASSSEKAPSRENSTKKPDHVHPKLPDFETIAAQMQSLRTNRRN